MNEINKQLQFAFNILELKLLDFYIDWIFYFFYSYNKFQIYKIIDHILDKSFNLIKKLYFNAIFHLLIILYTTNIKM